MTLDELTRRFEREPSQDSGLELAGALEAAGDPAAAIATAERALQCEMDFSQSELRPHRIAAALKELVARLRHPRAALGDRAWEWQGDREYTYGVRVDARGLSWFVRYASGKESAMPQTLSSFVAYGPIGSPRPDPAVVRELAALLDAAEQPWFQRYRG